MQLEQILSSIHPADSAAMKQAESHWDSLAKPLGSLGSLEEAVIRIAGITGRPQVSLEKRQLLVLCADNGVVARGVSQSGPDVTAAVARALGDGSSTVCHLLKGQHCDVRPVDIGMLDHPPFPGLEDRHIRRGTGDISREPAMSREACLQAVGTGMELAKRARAEGVDILLTGEMGIGNTTTSCAAASVLLNRPPRELAGRGAGLSHEGLERKIRAIEDALALHRPDPGDPVDILAKVGGLDLAGLAGVCLGGALYRVPILLDGVITLAAALCAVRLCPDCRDALLASHMPAEPAGTLLLKELALSAPIAAGLRLGEGSGAAMALPLLDMALQVYHSRHTFGELGIEAYRRLDS